MTIKQIFVVVAAVALVFILFFFADIVPPEKRDLQTAAVSIPSSGTLGVFMEEERVALSDSVSNQLAALDSSIQAAGDSVRTAELLKTAVEMAVEEELILREAHYKQAYAELVKTAGAWEESGDAYAQILFRASEDTVLRNEIAAYVIDSYEEALQLDENNSDLSIKLASAFMDGTNEVMKGVTLLLSVVEKEPKNIKANLILGRYGMLSGQYDKAITRLETVVEQDSLNAEAYFYLAEAYNIQGNREKAIELFEKTKSLVNDPEFSSEIDRYIEKIKNS